MYKIKDGVDLKILENYGYKLIDNVTVLGNNIREFKRTTSIYRKIYNDYKNKISVAIIIDEYDKKISFYDDKEYIKDLIDDGLVEERNE